MKKVNPLLFFRISLFSAIFLLACLVILVLTALYMSDKLKVQAQFFPIVVSKSNEFSQPTLHEFSQLNSFSPMYFGTKVNGMDIGVRDKEVIDEMLARYYLELRYSQIPDLKEMVYRWGKGGPLYFLSSPKLYENFIGKNWEQKMASLSSNVISIHIKKVEREKNNSFNIDFDLYENMPDGQHSFKSKHVNLKFVYTFANSRIKYSSFFSNPYGLVFTSLDEA